MTLDSIIGCALELTKNGLHLVLVWRKRPALLLQSPIENEFSFASEIAVTLPILARLDVRMEGEWVEDRPGRIQLRKPGEDWEPWVDVPGLYHAALHLGLDVKWDIPAVEDATMKALRNWVSGAGDYSAVEAGLRALGSLPENTEERAAAATKAALKRQRETKKKQRESTKRAATRFKDKYLPDWSISQIKSKGTWFQSAIFTSPTGVTIETGFGTHERPILKRPVRVRIPDGPGFSASLTDALAMIQNWSTRPPEQ